MEESKSASKIVTGKPTKKALGKFMRRWEDKITINLK
jgi:hypothetical protein